MALNLAQSDRCPLGFHQNRIGRRSGAAICLVGLLLSAPAWAAQQPAAAPKAKRTPLELLQTAHTLFLQKDYEAAREYYLEVLPSYPKNFDVLKNLAHCFYQRGPRGYGQAASYYLKALAVSPDSVEVSENLARCYVGLNRHAEAGAIFEKMAQQPGAPALNWKRAAEAYADGERNRQAEAAFDAYLQRNPGDLDARTRLGNLYASEKNYPQAQEQYRIVLSSNPNYSAALVGMGRLSSWQGQHEEALKYFDRVLRLNPNHGEAETAKAFTLLWLDRYEESQALFQKLRKRHPRSAEIARGLDQVEAGLRQRELVAARRAGDTARIEAYYRERLARNPNDLSALKALAEAASTPERCAESIGLSRKGLEVAPSDLGFESRLARALVHCQQYAEAVAHYNRILQSDPKSEGTLTELGSTLLRARRHPEAVETFRKALQLDPQNSDAALGLALALAASRNYDEALVQYDRVLARSPSNYDALQGKAFILFWTGKRDQSRAIFQSLAALKPEDRQNSEALASIAAADEEDRWISGRPASGSPPQDWIAYYDKRLAAYPDDLTALKGRAYQQAQLDDLPATIQGYRHVLAKAPDDVSAKRELARFLARDRQYEESIRLYGEVLNVTPENTDVLESLARVYVWNGQDREALTIYQKLIASNPSNASYHLEAARLQLRFQDAPGARQSLNAALAAEPQNRDAQIQVARLDMMQGDRVGALKHYEDILKQNPRDSTALLGKAQILFYQGEMPQAHAAASEVVAAEPNNFDAVFLLASIEHAQHRRKRSLELLDRAATISPDNSEVAAMRRRIRSESAVTLRTTASYAREIGPETESAGRAGLPNQDLRTFVYGGTLGFSFLPRTDSYFSYTALPTNAPPGPRRDEFGNQVPTGITGAVVPHQFLYRQSTRASDQWTFRAGAGLVRFGPGELVDLPGQPGLVTAADVSPLGMVGTTYSPTKHFSLDIDVSHMPIAYTPTSVKYGVMRSRFGGGLNFFFDPRTDLRLDYSYGHFRSHEINGVTTRDDAHFGEVDFNRVVATSDGISFDLGAEAIWYGFAGQKRDVYMGFFNPSLYQRYLLTPRIYGKLYGPVGYELRGGIGVQKSDRENPVKLGGRVSPTLTFRVSDHFSFGLGYTYYNTAQALGSLRGNAVRLTTDWKF